MTPETWLSHRQSGALAHISSLPSDTGIGNLGAGAIEFVDFLSEAGFSNWQVCPAGPTGYGDSPYQSFSAFAGNPYFIDLEELERLSLLSGSEIEPLAKLSRERVDYGAMYRYFWDILEKAFDRVDLGTLQFDESPSYQSFLNENSYWLEDYTIFMALKKKFGYRSWIEWPDEFKAAGANVEERLADGDRVEKARHRFYQYAFFCQWARLKRYANNKGVRLIGDVPIYVALDSADAWKNRSVFLIGANGELDRVAGVPPDYFSERGQLWGNPLYDWEALQASGYAWWIARFRAMLQQFDILRLDHFRGFESFWSVPADAPDASPGNWESGPGVAFFDAVREAFPHARFIAEDLGYINRKVYELRKRVGYPGMKVIQFGYGHDDNNVNLPHFYQDDHVVYTGTHDNNTTRGWLDELDGDRRSLVGEYFKLGPAPSAWDFIDAAFASVAKLVVVPLQDLLDLPSSTRMNTPGISSGNWQWRLTREQLDQLRSVELERINALHQRFNRIDDGEQRDFSAPPLKPLDPPEAGKQVAPKTAIR